MADLVSATVSLWFSVLLWAPFNVFSCFVCVAEDAAPSAPVSCPRCAALGMSQGFVASAGAIAAFTALFLDETGGPLPKPAASCSACVIRAAAPGDPAEPVVDELLAIDCEMCKTSAGLELTRITVVNQAKEVLYDTFVVRVTPLLFVKK